MNTSIIKKYVFDYTNSNMYIIAENGSALVIDPHISEEALNYLDSNNVRNTTVLLTHEHYDHTSGLTWLSSHFESTVICHEQTAFSLINGRNNRPIVIFSSRMSDLSTEEKKDFFRSLPQGYRCTPDITFTNEYSFDWKNHMIKMIHCPGHSPGSCCIEIDDNITATGDSLILNTPVITRFPGGSEEEYMNKTLPYLERISDDTLILPGHGEIFYMKEARQNHEKS